MAIVGSLPISLANGTLADATQVMTDFNYIVSQVNGNAAGLLGGNNFTGTQTIAGDTIVTQAAAQTLTNKTINGATISGTLTGDLNVTGNSTLGSATTNTLNVGAGGIIKDSSGRTGIGGAPTTVHLLQVKGTSDNQVLLDNTAGTQYTSAYWANSGTVKAEAYWDQTNTTFRVGATATNSQTAIVSNGDTVRVIVDLGGNTYPNTNNGQTLGGTGNRWSNVYSVLGNFSGAVTATGGLTFDGTNTLAAYTAPTSFTPGIAFGGGTTGITYSSRTGRYTQVGKVVYFTASISLSSKGSSTGTMTMTGLPLAVESSDNFFVIVAPASMNSAFTNPMGYAQFNQSFVNLGYQPTNGSFTQFSNTDCANTSTFQLTGWYMTS